MRDKIEYIFLPLLAVLIVGFVLHNPKAGPSNIYPPIPGVINPNVSQGNINQTICVKGWTAIIRPPVNYTTKIKVEQLKSGQKLSDYELDHFIPLELGGDPISPQNLWMEPYNASIPDGGARNKDYTENYLKKEVCSGKMTLAEAQKEIQTDWYKIYLSIKNQFGAGSPESIDEDDL